LFTGFFIFQTISSAVMAAAFDAISSVFLF
jgi:hypothetical protein